MGRYSENKRSHVVFIDVKNAYDRVLGSYVLG